MTKHTPAPWVIDEYGDISSERCDTATAWVAINPCDDVSGIVFKCDADRDLILAAPDMYEALQAAKALMDVEGMRGVVYAVVCDALKKARGEV